MLSVIIDDISSDLLERTYISPFGGRNREKFHPGAKLTARPDIKIEAYTRHSPGSLIQMGAFSYVSANGPAIISLNVGRYCSIAIGVRVMDGHHPLMAVTTNPYTYGVFYRSPNIPGEYVYEGPRQDFTQSYGPVNVGNDVWIGSHCTIKAGITIGHGAVITGGANVVKDVPPYAIVGGNPARIIRYRFPEDIRKRLLALEWWNISPKLLRHCNMYEPEAFCDALERRKAQDRGFEPFRPDFVRITAKGEIVRGASFR